MNEGLRLLPTKLFQPFPMYTGGYLFGGKITIPVGGDDDDYNCAGGQKGYNFPIISQVRNRKPFSPVCVVSMKKYLPAPIEAQFISLYLSVFTAHFHMNETFKKKNFTGNFSEF